jgi:hypothetical protein
MMLSLSDMVILVGGVVFVGILLLVLSQLPPE